MPDGCLLYFSYVSCGGGLGWEVKTDKKKKEEVCVSGVASTLGMLFDYTICRVTDFILYIPIQCIEYPCKLTSLGSKLSCGKEILKPGQAVF